MRLDLVLVEKNLFESRNKAQNSIKSGNIYVNGKKITQSGFDVSENDIITIKGNALKYVSKGGLKLEKLLKNYKRLSLKDKVMIDIGSSTGGFTDCALKNGAKKVYAIDVGTNQLHKSLRENDKVICLENTDFREVDTKSFEDAVICSIDVSFISSLKILEKLKEFENINEVILLIKPQFECGKEIADRYKGIILNRDIHQNIITKLLSEYKKCGYLCKYITYSPIKEQKGNIEYIAYFDKIIEQNTTDIKDVITKAFSQDNKFYKKK